MKRSWIATLIVFALGWSGTASAELVLLDNGEALAPIVVFEGAPPTTRETAGQLAEYIEKISGVRPPILDGRPDPLPERAIWVGVQPVLEEIFPGIDFDFQEPEEILIAANDLPFWAAYDAAFFERAEGLLAEAEAAVADARDVYPTRIAHVRIGLDYTRLYVDTLELVKQFEDGRRDEEVVGRLRPNLEQMLRMVQGDTTYTMGPTHHLRLWILRTLEKVDAARAE